MNLKLRRRFKGPNYTIGSFYINDEYFCDTIEDTDRGLDDNMSEAIIKGKKIYGKTAIPTGTYKITLNVISPKYSDFNKYKWAKQCEGRIPRLINVKGFDGVLIHVGNTEQDSLGCIIVGENKVKGKVINSTNTFTKLYSKLKECVNKEDITLTII